MILLLSLLLGCASPGLPTDSPAAPTEAANVALIYGGEHPCLDCAPLPVEVNTSSTLTERKVSYSGKNLVDGRIDTMWCEGALGQGLGQWMEFRFPRPVHLDAITILGGYFLGLDILKGSGRLRELRLNLTTSVGKRSVLLKLDDPAVVRPIVPPVSEKQWFSLLKSGPATFRPATMLAADETVTQVRLTVLSLYPGPYYDDACAAEVQFFGTG